MLDIETAQEQGKLLAVHLSEIIKEERRHDMVELTLAVLATMKILISGAPPKVKERVQTVMSSLAQLSRECSTNEGKLEPKSVENLEAIVRSIGGVSETLVQWYVNKKMRHEITAEDPSTESGEEAALVRKFSNFLTRRNVRQYLPTLHNPDTALEMSVAVYEKSSAQLRKEPQYPAYLPTLTQALRALCSLLDIEDRLFVNRFPYRAQVFSFTEEFVSKARKSRSCEPHLSQLASLSEAVDELVAACRERLSGDVSLKRAESMAMRSGGANRVTNRSVSVKVTPLDIQCKIECNKAINNSTQQPIPKGSAFVLRTLSSATVPYLIRKLCQQLGLPAHAIQLQVSGDDVTNNTTLRAQDFTDKLLVVCDAGDKIKPTLMVKPSGSIAKAFARAVYDFQVQGSANLCFNCGDIIEVVKKHYDGWWDGRINQRTGTFPASYVEELSENQLMAALSPLNILKQSRQKENIPSILATPLPTPTKPSRSLDTPDTFATPKASKTPRSFLPLSSASKREGSFFTPSSKTVKMDPLLTIAEETPGERRRKQAAAAKDHKILGSLKEGLLKKEGSGGKIWNARYFVLHKDRVVYYKSTQARPPPQGIIPFSEIVFAAATSNRPAHSHCFTLQGIVGKRAYYLMAKSQEDMNDWIQSLNQALRVCKAGSRYHSVVPESEHSVVLAAAAACMDYLMCDNRYKQANILKVPGNAREVKQCLKIIERGELPELELIPNANTVAGLFKALFRLENNKIPPLVPRRLCCMLTELLDKEDAAADTRCALLTLDSDSFAVLRAMIRLFSLIVDNTDKNNLLSIDLARFFGILIFEGQDVNGAHRILDYLIATHHLVLA